MKESGDERVKRFYERRDCEHGQLARSCEICQLAARAESAEALLIAKQRCDMPDDYVEVVKKLEAKLAVAVEALRFGKKDCRCAACTNALDKIDAIERAT